MRSFVIALCGLLAAPALATTPPVFVDKAMSAGLGGIEGSSGGYSGGIVFADLDGDRWPDLFVGLGKTQKNVLCINRHDGTFSCGASGPANNAGVMGIVAADYDGNGTLDLYLCTYGYFNVLLSNDGAGHFTDVTATAKVGGKQGWYNESASFFDYDHDGYLDLHVTAWDESGPSAVTIDQMFHNRGDGTFDSVPLASVGLDNQMRPGLMELAFDFDGDGWVDLYRGSDFDQAILFHNRGNGTFDNVSATQPPVFQNAVREAMGGDVADFNGDGLLDFYVSDSASTDSSVGNGLFINRGDGTFDSSAIAYGVAADFSWGVGAFDFDNDTWPDLFVGSFWAGHHFVFENQGGTHFIETHLPELQVGSRDTVTTAFADYDGDGLVDAIAYGSDGRPLELWHNETPSTGRWIELHLNGAAPRTDPVGALVKVTAAGGRMQPRPVMSEASHASVNDRRMHFGLGDATTADIEVDWPSGAVEHVMAVAANQSVRIVEGKGLQALDLPPTDMAMPHGNDDMAVSGDGPATKSDGGCAFGGAQPSSSSALLAMTLLCMLFVRKTRARSIR